MWRLPITKVHRTSFRFSRLAAKRPRIRANRSNFQSFSKFQRAEGPYSRPVSVLIAAIAKSAHTPNSHQPNADRILGIRLRATIMPNIVNPAANREKRIPTSTSGSPHHVAVGSV